MPKPTDLPDALSNVSDLTLLSALLEMDRGGYRKPATDLWNIPGIREYLLDKHRRTFQIPEHPQDVEVLKEEQEEREFNKRACYTLTRAVIEELYDSIGSYYDKLEELQ